MDSVQIEQILTAGLSDCEITVEGGDGKYLVTAIGQVFEGLNAVKRQQTIYKILNEHISSGAIHAVSMNLMTVEESEAA
ncbi:MAG: BolA/IbaG family iron-sulfur metabolism protein [Gammaproteobacteria bacterium]|nr:BolA/IbaG family iron-sulfur metabolism protein [Gammaproteobacteria bacterium]MBT3859923.1 BolA/IbaG family iron-sulfur metabolism protein [Gammaproteobacteria bacterium]MBT3986385.1 BolA/IbaG family iron-sulfur metabolism protein [Gammaproteobacteria bacterium]MBT4255022.1 BolA/IbaG family iron-sulfur metabolism protein [Gammaproteobacteria bacterium]MBT4582945.1 BolA/IbaG family iron-sulfur metabolism protein [Gammaproteobacteria bacterium]